MRLNTLFLNNHKIDENGLSMQLSHRDCQINIARIEGFSQIERAVLEDEIDLLVLKASVAELGEWAKSFHSLEDDLGFSVLYITEKEDEAGVDSLKALGARHIVCETLQTTTLASLILLIAGKKRQKRTLSAVGDYMKDALIICEKDEKGEFVFKHLNKVFLEKEGIEEASLLNKRVKESRLYFGAENLIVDMNEVFKSKEARHLPNYFYDRDERREWCDIYIFKIDKEQIAIISSSLSELKRVYDKAQESNRYLQTILNAQHHIIYITDGKKLITTNQSFLDFFGCNTMYDFIKRHGIVCNLFEKATEPFYIDTNEPQWHKKVAENKMERYKVRLKIDEVVHVFVPSVDIINIENKEQYVVILTDVTELESEKEKLRLLAMTDPLTGAANRLQFNTMIDQFTEVSKRYDAPMSVIMFDIDHFKSINDNYSHQLGDEVLKEFVDLVMIKVRRADLLVRWGGEEFLLILTNTSLANAQKVAEKFRKSIDEASFVGVEHITCSFGVTVLDKEDTISELIARADEALYQSKLAGRNCVRTVVRS